MTFTPRMPANGIQDVLMMKISFSDVISDFAVLSLENALTKQTITF
jgi:hypothetical protein